MTYTYGVAGATENRVGKPVSVEDGSGKQEFKYGRQGEVTEVKRTLVIPNQAVATYTTKTPFRPRILIICRLLIAQGTE